MREEDVLNFLKLKLGGNMQSVRIDVVDLLDSGMKSRGNYLSGTVVVQPGGRSSSNFIFRGSATTTLVAGRRDVGR